MTRLREDQLQEFYEDCYTPSAAAAEGEHYRRWRELGAVTKADHVVALAARAGLGAVGTVAEVGCGDGAVLGVLGRRGFGARRVGYEISASGVALAAQRPEIDEAQVFDGARLPVADGAYDVVFATHVLEHVPDPQPLVTEMARVAARAVIVEVPLEANLSARRPAARAASEGVGHLHAFDRAQIRAYAQAAGLRPRAELADALPRAVHAFGATTPAARAKGTAKWAIRAGLTALPGHVADRLFTLHYALIATPT